MTDLNKSNSIVLLTGDFNIDLLKLQDRQIIREYLECIISHGLCPALTLPSRIVQNSATFIDNVFSNVHNKLSHNSGIIETNISDHFPYFYRFKTTHDYVKPVKHIFHRKYNDANIYNLSQYLDSLNIMDLLQHDKDIDPNINYNILEKILIIGLDKYIPLNKVKLNKYKHKKTNWITYGIIRSIKFRDHLYRRLKQVDQNTPEYFNLKVNLSTYNTILKQLIREAKSNFYQAKFEQCRLKTNMGNYKRSPT